jgi:hypothetical protein
MRVACAFLILTLTAAPAVAQEQTASTSESGRGALFWSGLALGVAGVTTSVIGVTAARVETTSSGNAPANTYQMCVAQKAADPIYATNQCDALKGKNNALLWSGVAISALGGALMIGSTRTHAEIAPGFVRLLHTIRF